VRAISAYLVLVLVLGLAPSTTLVTACGSPPAPRPIANLRGPLPPQTITCFAGMYTEYDGERVHIVMRRTVDPVASTIRQEAVRTSGGFGFVMRGQVDLSVTGSTFRSHTPDDARGEGRLDGPAWAWTHWTETRHHANGNLRWTEEIEGWLDAEQLRFRGRHVERSTAWSAELGLLDCAEYEARIERWEKPDEPLDP
jgi:hypothetical protein